MPARPTTALSHHDTPIATTLDARAALRAIPARAKPAALPARLHGRDVVRRPAIDFVPAVHAIVRNQVQNPTAPLTIAAIVVLFLLVQHRIDRRDPKLAVAMRPESTLEFGSAVRA